jgi:hypothetical protein
LSRWIWTHSTIPEKYFINGGGAVLLAQREDTGEIVGTVALQPFGNGVLELAKMTVAENARGLKIGELLGASPHSNGHANWAPNEFSCFPMPAKPTRPSICISNSVSDCVALESNEFKRANIQMEITVDGTR